MNLSVSNIAWNRDEINEALAVLKKYKINCLEIAPTLLFDDILILSDEEIKKTKSQYRAKGFSFVAMQSLLYGIPNYSIFDDSQKVGQLFNYLLRIVAIAHLLGTTRLVFGSPKNRTIRNLASRNNDSLAVSFFQKLSAAARKNGTVICFEANPKEYGCNFIVDTFEAIEFVKKVNHPNFKLNLDIGTILMNEENPEEVINKADNLIGHIHISTPYLGKIASTEVDHNYFSRLIRESNYDGFVSLEMKKNPAGSSIQTLEENVKIFVEHYGTGCA